jgi:general stress protein 26
MDLKDAKIAVRDVVDSLIEGRGEALLITASASGKPHATWMATIALPDAGGRLITITSPTSRKVTNIRENAEVEWLFSDEPKRCLVYLECDAEVVDDPAEIKHGWASLPDKDRAYFLNYINSGIGFAVIASKVRSATLVIPRAGQSYCFQWEEILALPSRSNLQPSADNGCAGSGKDSGAKQHQDT